jgi:hypothetical protein
MSVLSDPLVSILGATHPSLQKSTGVQPWQLVVGVSVILTLLLGLGTFFDWGTRIRDRRVNKEIQKLVRSELEAKSIEEKLVELTQLNDSLREQISMVPGEVDRLVVQRRMEQLAIGLSRDFEEYRSLERGLKPLGTETKLDSRIRDVIENTMLPPQRQRERRNIYTLLLLVALVALNLSPISANDLVYSYFNILSNSVDWTVSSVTWSLLIGALVIAVILLFASELLTFLRSFLDKLRHPIWLGLLALATVIASVLGYAWRAELAGLTCSPLPCSSPYAQYSGSYPAALYIGAGIAFNLAPLIAGFFLAVLVRRFQRHVRARYSVATGHQGKLEPLSDSNGGARE